jgi:hypothetical protein
MLGSSWIAAQVAASQEGLSSMSDEWLANIKTNFLHDAYATPEFLKWPIRSPKMRTKRARKLFADLVGTSDREQLVCCRWTHRDSNWMGTVRERQFRSGHRLVLCVCVCVCVSGGSHAWSRRPIHELITLFGAGRLFANSSRTAREF